MTLDPERLLTDPAASRCLSSGGYVVVSLDGQSALEHRLVMAAFLKRSLAESESIHHRNGIRHDNRLHNLELWAAVHPSGQRVTDLVRWLLRDHRDLFIGTLTAGRPLRPAMSFCLDDLAQIAALDGEGRVLRRTLAVAGGRRWETRVKVVGTWIGEHRAMAMIMLERELHRGETVHHRNGDTLDNRPENLEIWSRHHPSGQRVSDLAEWLIRDHYTACLTVMRTEGIANVSHPIEPRGHTRARENAAA